MSQVQGRYLEHAHKHSSPSELTTSVTLSWLKYTIGKKNTVLCHTQRIYQNIKRKTNMCGYIILEVHQSPAKLIWKDWLWKWNALHCLCVLFYFIKENTYRNYRKKKFENKNGLIDTDAFWISLSKFLLYMVLCLSVFLSTCQYDLSVNMNTSKTVWTAHCRKKTAFVTLKLKMSDTLALILFWMNNRWHKIKNNFI